MPFLFTKENIPVVNYSNVSWHITTLTKGNVKLPLKIRAAIFVTEIDSIVKLL